jgi:hypothetical protein
LSDLTIELLIGYFPGRLPFTFKNQSHLIIPVSQQIFREIQPGTGKPFGAGHFADIIDDLVVGLAGLDIGKVPHGSPEIRDLIDGPLIEVLISCNIKMVPLVYEAYKSVHIGALYSLYRRLPE